MTKQDRNVVPDYDEKLRQAHLFEAELAQKALGFLGRTQMQGNEVGAFVEVHNWLTALVERPKVAAMRETAPDAE